MAKIIQLSDSSGNIFPRTANGTLTSSDSIDDIRREGTYWCNTISGRPQTSNAYAFLLVFVYGQTVVMQVYVPFTTNGFTEIYSRPYANSQWYAWRKLTTTAV